MKQFVLIGLIALAGCTSARPIPLAQQQCPPPPVLPFSYSLDEKSGDHVLIPQDMAEKPVFRWNTTSQSSLYLYPPDGAVQGREGKLKAWKFKKPGEQPATPEAQANPKTDTLKEPRK